MKKTQGLKVGSLILAATLFAGPGFIPHAGAQDRSYHSYLIDPSSRTATNLGTLGGDTFARGVNNAGQVEGLSLTAAGDRRAFVTGPDWVGVDWRHLVLIAMLRISTLPGRRWHVEQVDVFQLQQVEEKRGFFFAQDETYFHRQV